MFQLLNYKNVNVKCLYRSRNMLEILCKILFFLSMLVVYANVTSTSIVIVIVLAYIACVFSYYYFNNIQGAIDECLNYCNFNAKLSDNANSSQISGYFMNRKYNKINNNNIGSIKSKKIIGGLCNSDNSFPKENSMLEGCGSSMMKTDYKNGELPSPIMKNNSPVKSKLCRNKLKIMFNQKEVNNRKSSHMYNSLNPGRRYNANLDLETYMNVSSPGFTSRVVDKAAESASYHIKYPAVRQVAAYRFDKSTLRQLSKIPKAASTPAVRIAPPESTSMDLLTKENVIANEKNNEDIRNNSILQVLKDMSRKRNYTQEEADRTGSTPKKSRKTDVKNTVSSQHKRAHEDCSNDSIEDTSRKKRCDDADRDIAKMMSYTSSISVLAPGDFTWNSNSKKRKSSRLEKAKNDSAEKMEKFRKISELSADEMKQDMHREDVPRPKIDATYVVKPRLNDTHSSEKHEIKSVNRTDECDSKPMEIPFTDDDTEYIRVASGKILNRTNCIYRKKLNSSKIDPDSVITNEPEYVTGFSYIDDKTMKENLLKNFINDVERKGEKNDNVIFYQNSIVEEVAKNVFTQVEVHEPSTIICTSSRNPLLPTSMQPAKSFQSSSSIVTSNQLSNISSVVTQSSPSTLFDKTNKRNNLEELKFNCQLQDVTDSVQNIASSNEIKAAPISETSLTSQAIMNTTSSVSSTTKSEIPPLSTNVTSQITNTNSVSTSFSSSCITKSDEISKQATFTEPVQTSSTIITSGSSDFPLRASNISTSSSNNQISKNNLSCSKESTVELKNFSFGSTPVTFSNENENSGVDAPKISMFGNTVIRDTKSSPSSSDVFVTSASTATIVSSNATSALFTNTTQTFSPKPTFKFGQTSTTTKSTANSSSSGFNFTSSNMSNNEVKCDPSQPIATTISAPISSVTSTPTFNAGSTFGDGTSTFGNNASLPFNTTSVATFSSVNTPSFGTAGIQAAPPFSFGSQPANFGTGASQSSVFNATTQANSAMPIVFGTTVTTSAVPPTPFGVSSEQSLFGTSIQSSITPSVFGTRTQIAQPNVFGSDNEIASQPSLFNTNSQPARQTSIFGSTPQVNVTLNAPVPQTLFGGGDSACGNMFGQSQNATLPVGVVNPLPQTSQFGSSGRFTFGASTPTAPSAFGSTPAASAAVVPLGAATTGQPAFSATASTFNFQAGSSGFGTTSTNVFGTAGGQQPSSNPVFNFGSNTGTITQPAQSAFQFGGNTPAQPSQPFMFGSTAAPVSNVTGSFSIGSGGSSTRNRPIARPRKTK